MPTNRCPECGHDPIPPAANYCPNCGQLLDTTSSSATGTTSAEMILDQTGLAEEEFKALALDEADVGLTLFDRKSPGEPIIYINNVILEMTGYSREEILGNNGRMLRGPDTDPEAARQIDQAVEQGHSTEVEILNYRKDGTPFWNLVRIRPLDQTAEDPRYYLDIQLDITERKEATEEFRRLQKEYETVFTSAQDAIFLVDVIQESEPQFELRRLNPAHEKVSGLSTEDDRGKSPRELLGEEQGAELEENYRRCLEVKEPISYEEVLEFPAGTSTWHTKMSPVLTEGEVTQIVGVSRDITQLKKQQQELEEKSTYLSTVLNAAPNIICVKDSNLRRELVNDAMVEFFETNRENLVGQKLSDTLSDRQARETERIQRSLLQQSKSSKDVIANYKKPSSGETHWFQERYVVINPEAKVEERKLLVIATDITDQKKIEEELKESLEQQTTLLQEVHHRVRNNLQNVISLLSLSARNIAESSAEKVLQENVTRIHSISLVHELLHDSENMANVSTDEYVRELVETVIDQIDPQQSIQTELDISPAIQFEADTLPTVGLIVNELVSNSVEHAFAENEGTVTISLESRDKGYELMVRDDGRGIDMDPQQADSETLGLTLVQNLAEEQLNGTIHFTSNEGTRVVITFPEP